MGSKMMHMGRLFLLIICSFGALVVGCSKTAKCEQNQQNISVRLLRIWRDFSSSMGETIWKRFIPVTVEVLQKNNAGLDGIEVVRFSEADLQTSAQAVVKFPFHMDMDEAEPSLASKLKIGSAIRAEDKSRTAKNDAAIILKLKSLRDYLETEPRSAASCTPFRSLAIRIAEENCPLNLLITDGWADCDDIQKIECDPAANLLIVLFPRKGDPLTEEDTLFDKRSRDLRVLFPSARIVRPYLLEKELDKLLTNPEPFFEGHPETTAFLNKEFNPHQNPQARLEQEAGYGRKRVDK
jgi:hypothetical protein